MQVTSKTHGVYYPQQTVCSIARARMHKCPRALPVFALISHCLSLCLILSHCHWVLSVARLILSGSSHSLWLLSFSLASLILFGFSHSLSFSLGSLCRSTHCQWLLSFSLASLILSHGLSLSLIVSHCLSLSLASLCRSRASLGKPAAGNPQQTWQWYP